MPERSRFTEWVDARTGIPSLLDRAAAEPVRGGAGLRYVFGTALAGALLVQLVTGLLLMTSYVPSSSHAWGSVWYIQSELTLGWVVRGLHHFGSSAVVVLLVLHLVQTIVQAAYRAPREVNWWLGLLMMFAALGLALTGYLLPWDQKGYWATRVATNIAGSTPVVGPLAQRVLVGGIEYGNLTLTRLYGLHVGILPMLLIAGLIGHWLLARRHGLTGRDRPEKTEPYRPAQVFYNLVAFTIAVGVLLAIVLANHGAGLEAPADPSSTDYPARPEWYFLALYQLLNEFESPYEIIGTMVIPGAIVTVLFLLPVLDRLFPKRLVHFGACALVFGILGGAGSLMIKAIVADWNDPAFQLARREADRQRDRARELAEAGGLPPEGASYLLADDPLTHGMALLESKCLSCHVYDGRGRVTTGIAEPTAEELAAADPGRLGISRGAVPEESLRRLASALPEDLKGTAVDIDGEHGAEVIRLTGTNAQGERVVGLLEQGDAHVVVTTHAVQSASDLKGFGTRDWVRGLLEDPSSSSYFGAVPQCEGMAKWKADSELTAEQLDEVADFFAEHVIPAEPGLSAQAWELPFLEAGEEAPPGYQHFMNECANCHFWGLGGADGTGVDAPNVYGWGSPTWTRRLIGNPSAADLYGYLEPHERMPGFGDQLTERDLETIIRLLKGDYLPSAAIGDRPETVEDEAIASH